MALSGYQRYCLNMQGYSQLSDEAKRQIDLAQRFKPTVCALLALLAVFTQIDTPYNSGAAARLLGCFLPEPPGRPPVPGGSHAPCSRSQADPVPRRFACGMAATLLLVGAIAWLLGAVVVGTIFVGLVALALLTLAVADFCVGSFFYWLLVRRQIFRGS